MKKNLLNKTAIALLACCFAFGLMVPAVSFATPEESGDTQDAATVDTAGSEGQESPSQPAQDCTVTLEYYENVAVDDPDIPVNDEGRRLMGSATLDNLTEGDVLDAWDYVVRIPGYFFFDAWPAKLTVSTDPSQNVMKFFYFRLHNNEYTVNYYVMTGADLTADNWKDALAPDDVEFLKIGSETFKNQYFDKLIKGDAYEYQIDGAYVIDSYPAEIRLSTDPDSNVINVLYTPTTTTLPDENEMPDDTILDKDDLPGGTGDDFIGSGVDDGSVEITDDMLANPVDRDEAELVAKAYRTGLDMGSNLSQTGDDNPLGIAIIVAIIAAAAAVITIIVFISSKKKDESPKR